MSNEKINKQIYYIVYINIVYINRAGVDRFSNLHLPQTEQELMFILWFMFRTGFLAASKVFSFSFPLP